MHKSGSQGARAMKREDVENEPTTAAAADDAAPAEKSHPDRLPPLIRPFVDWVGASPAHRTGR
jgi:hypothetical protein